MAVRDSLWVITNNPISSPQRNNSNALSSRLAIYAFSWERFPTYFLKYS